MRGQGLNDLPRCELERRSSHHKGIFFEVPLSYMQYNDARTHLSLNKDAPVPRAVQAVGHVLPTPILGGSHHHYFRV